MKQSFFDNMTPKEYIEYIMKIISESKFEENLKICDKCGEKSISNENESCFICKEKNYRDDFKRRNPYHQRARYLANKLKLKGNFCAICGISGPSHYLNFHHTNYEFNHGFTVCRICHADLHSKRGFCIEPLEIARQIQFQFFIEKHKEEYLMRYGLDLSEESLTHVVWLMDEFYPRFREGRDNQ